MESAKNYWKRAVFEGKRTFLNIFPQGGLFKIIPGFFAVMLHKVIDNVLFETEFDGDVLAEDDLAFENILVGKDEVDAGHQILKLLLDRQRPQSINGLGVADKVIYGFFWKMAVACNFEDHLALGFGEMLVGFSQLDEDVQLFFGNNIHREFT